MTQLVKRGKVTATTDKAGNQITNRQSKIIYPDSDGKPMAENTEQYGWLTLIKDGLEDLFAAEPNVFTAGDLFWYPLEGNNKLRVAPDVLVALGRPKGPRMTYNQWEEGNQPPQVCFEIWSPGNRANEKKHKQDFYQTYGVLEYYTYDPFSQELAGWQRDASGQLLVPIGQMRGHVSPLLGISFELDAQGLVLRRPDGEVFVSYTRMAARARQAERRALHEQAAREQAEHKATLAERKALREQTAREQAEQQLQALLAKLKASNIDPHSL